MLISPQEWACYFIENSKFEPSLLCSANYSNLFIINLWFRTNFELIFNSSQSLTFWLFFFSFAEKNLQICDRIQKKGWKLVRDSESELFYTYYNNQWASFDHPLTVARKSQYVKTHDLGGIMIWDIDRDDFHGNCFGRKFPLLTAINSILIHGKSIKMIPGNNLWEKLAQRNTFIFRQSDLNQTINFVSNCYKSSQLLNYWK